MQKQMRYVDDRSRVNLTFYSVHIMHGEILSTFMSRSTIDFINSFYITLIFKLEQLFQNKNIYREIVMP